MDVNILYLPIYNGKFIKCDDFYNGELWRYTNDNGTWFIFKVSAMNDALNEILIKKGNDYSIDLSNIEKSYSNIIEAWLMEDEEQYEC